MEENTHLLMFHAGSATHHVDDLALQCGACLERATIVFPGCSRLHKEWAAVGEMLAIKTPEELRIKWSGLRTGHRTSDKEASKRGQSDERESATACANKRPMHQVAYSIYSRSQIILTCPRRFASRQCRR